jgi:hypothetical protein
MNSTVGKVHYFSIATAEIMPSIMITCRGDSGMWVISRKDMVKRQVMYGKHSCSGCDNVSIFDVFLQHW